MAARARIVMRAPDAGAIIDAYFAAPVLDMSIQDKLTRRIAAHELVLLRLMMPPREAPSNNDVSWRRLPLVRRTPLL